MLVSRAQRRNAGICVDTWQYFGAKNAAEDLVAIPADHISTIRISHEVTAQEALDYTSRATQNRRGPEEGADLIRFLRTITQNGVTLPISVDVTLHPPMHTDPFAICSFLEDKTSSMWKYGVQV